MVTLTQTAYGGWSKTHTVSNGLVDLVITGDVGPRLIRFGFVGQANMFCEVPETLGKTGGDQWRIYGGHRLWHAPENHIRTYQPDNMPISVEQKTGFVQVTQPTEALTGIQKQMDIYMAEDHAHVRVVHRLLNQGLWPIVAAPWALSVMAAGGKAIMPLPPRGSHPQDLLPNTELVIWPYTNMADPRWTWGQKYILLQQDVNTNKPQKVGGAVPDGWGAFVREDTLFIKKFTPQLAATYPDKGCMVELFTNHFMLELETLAPLTTIQPQGMAEHVEDWFLVPDVAMPMTDADVEANIVPHVAAATA